MKKKPIGAAEIAAATEDLLLYEKAGQAARTRYEAEENYFRDHVTAHGESDGERRSGWLVNAILQRHADLMENIPTAVCHAREPEGENIAREISAILPAIFARNQFEAIYSDNMWRKLKHGICAFGVFWNTELENGLGDVDVRAVDLRDLYIEPGVRDVEEAKSVFYLHWMKIDSICARYPQCTRNDLLQFPMQAKRGGTGEEMVPLVDWYYKKRLPCGREVLHYCKYAGRTVLFASENDPLFENGWYEHGKYPFVLDILYPREEGCDGYGMIALGHDTQEYIDKMDRNLLEYMDWATRVRYFCKKNTGINTTEFSDPTKRIVEVEGDVDEERLRQITAASVDPVWLSLKDAKINELKEMTFNQNVTRGVTESGVVAASAIAALQEASKKSVRDAVGASYRAFVRMSELVIECVRQFYDEARCFRVTGTDGERYCFLSNEPLKERVIGTGEDGEPIYARLTFDLEIHAEKQDPYTKLSHNETLKELYRLGVFDPQNAAAASILLSEMEFPGVAQLRERVAAQVKANAAALSDQTPATVDHD